MENLDKISIPTKEIEEGNVLIAKFLGYQMLHKKFQYRNWNSSDESYFSWDEDEIVCDANGNEINLYNSEDPLFNLTELPFDSDWNSLIKAVEKIETELSDFSIQIDGDRCTIFVWNGSENVVKFNKMHTGSKIESTWIVIVQFIKWYNEEKNKKF